MPEGGDEMAAEAEDRDQYDNPVAAGARNGASAFETEEGADGDAAVEAESPSPRKVAEHVTELTNDELSDLTFAFQACDVDAEGTIDVDELHSMLALLGTEITIDQTASLMKKAKRDFKNWLAGHEVGTELPEYFDQEAGTSPSGVQGETKHGGDRHFHEISIDKANRHHPVLSPLKKAQQNTVVKVVAAPVLAPVKLLDMSYQMAKKAIPSKTAAAIDETKLTDGDALAMVEDALPGKMDSNTEMIFAEYVHMMCGETIKEYVPADWRKSAYQMRLYRNAYDTADVDGGEPDRLLTIFRAGPRFHTDAPPCCRQQAGVPRAGDGRDGDGPPPRPDPRRHAVPLAGSEPGGVSTRHHPAACTDVCSPWPLAQTVFAETDGCLSSGTRS